MTHLRTCWRTGLVCLAAKSQGIWVVSALAAVATCSVPQRIFGLPRSLYASQTHDRDPLWKAHLNCLNTSSMLQISHPCPMKWLTSPYYQCRNILPMFTQEDHGQTGNKIQICCLPLCCTKVTYFHKLCPRRQGKETGKTHKGKKSPSSVWQ